MPCSASKVSTYCANKYSQDSEPLFLVPVLSLRSEKPQQTSLPLSGFVYRNLALDSMAGVEHVNPFSLLDDGDFISIVDAKAEVAFLAVVKEEKRRNKEEEKKKAAEKAQSVSSAASIGSENYNNYRGNEGQNYMRVNRGYYGQRRYYREGNGGHQERTQSQGGEEGKVENGGQNYGRVTEVIMVGGGITRIATAATRR